MKSALVVLFNQDFSSNIPKLEEIYKNRFDKIVYLVPDHTARLDRMYKGTAMPSGLVLAMDRIFSIIRRLLGRRNANEIPDDLARVYKDKIIRVVGHQFYFYQFIVQAAERLFALDVDWYWVTADDALINPRLDQETLPAKLGVNTGIDLVLCRPVYGSDDWIAHVSGSVDAAIAKFQTVFGHPPPWITAKTTISSEEGADRNIYIPVACMDFFGVSRDLLKNVLGLWKRCFRYRLYVELAGPMALLSRCRHHLYLDDYDWRRAATTDVMQSLSKDLESSGRNIFAHPIKLSMV